MFKYGDEEIIIDNLSFNIGVLKDLLSDNFYFSLKKIYKDENHRVEVLFDLDEDDCLCGSYPVSKFTRALEEYMLDADDKEFDRILSLRDKASFEAFIDKYKDKSTIMLIDNIKYRIKYKDIISFLFKEEYFYRSFFNEQCKSLYGMNKDHFLYAVKRIFEEYDYRSFYIFPNYVNERLNRLFSYRDHDFEAVNKYTSINDRFVNNTIVSDELYNEVMDNMPNEYDLVDKSIYLYIKLCQLFSYDETFYINNQQGESAKKHEDIKRIRSIKPYDDIVCYEFTLLYSYFLREIGVNFDTSNTDKTKYGGAHVNLAYRADKFLVVADAVNSIIYGDITGAKVNAPISGLSCYNKNLNTKQEFKDRVERVYSNMKSDNYRFLDTLNNTDNLKRIRNMPFEYRNFILFDLANKSGLNGLDATGYFLRLRRKLFSDIEREENVYFNILKYNDNGREKVEGIITIDNGDNNLSYYEYIPSKGIEKISKEDLIDKFNNNKISFIDYNLDTIPGLCEPYKVYRKSK